MDFDELIFRRRPNPVKSTKVTNDFDFEDPDTLIDQVLGTPSKIEIPDRYIPDLREPEAPEEEEKRSQTADRLRRLLSKSNCAGALPLVLPKQQQQQPHNNLSYSNSIGGGSSSRSRQYPISGLGNGSGISASESLGVNNYQGLSSSQNRSRRPLSSSLKKASSSSRLYRNTPRSSNCDWSLAGVSAPTSPHPSSSHHSSYYSSSNSASNLYASNNSGSNNVGSSSKPNHSYHSSYSSTSSGRSSSDRCPSDQDLLHLQHNIAREITEKSRLVAVRALASSPSPNPYRSNYSSGSRYREPSPPSPIDLPTIQQLKKTLFTIYMHTDLSLHLHTPECCELIIALHTCHRERTFMKFLGACNDIDTALWKCLKKERLARRAANFETSGAKKMLSYQLDREKEAQKQDQSASDC